MPVERLQLMALTQMILLCARHVRTHELYNLIHLLLGTISDLMIAPAHNITIESGTTVITAVLHRKPHHDGSRFICLVKSPQLYSPIEETITVTVQGM